MHWCVRFPTDRTARCTLHLPHGLRALSHLLPFVQGVLLFLLATGNAPYDQRAEHGGPLCRQLGSPRDDANFVLLYTGRLPALLELLPLRAPLSADLVDLLQRMLTPPERRIDIRGVLAHPWLQRAAAGPLLASPRAERRARAHAGLQERAVAAAAAAAACFRVGQSAVSGAVAAAAAARASPLLPPSMSAAASVRRRPR